MSTAPATSGFKRKKLLTRPVLKFIQDEPRHVRIESAIYLGKEMKNDRPGDNGKKREPAHLADVVDLETGSLAQIIVSAVVLSVLQESYPDNTYVGLCFSITKLGRQPGKQYFGYSVEEIEDPVEQKSASPSGRSVKEAKGG